MKKKKKNPVDNNYIDSLLMAIKLGNPVSLTAAITYYKQGYMCKDCPASFFNCRCEYCDECGFNRCLCDLGQFNRDKIKKVAWELAQLTLTEEQFQNLITTISPTALRYVTEKLKDIRIPTIDQKWLASK